MIPERLTCTFQHHFGDKQIVANDDILPMLKTAESLYQLLPAETTARLLAALPKAGAVLVNVSNIGNVGGSANSNDPVLWMNGTYQLKLDQV